MSQALATHFAHDTLLPRSPGGNGFGAVLALLAHGTLVWALTSTVQWRTWPPDVVSAELWASVPQAAAPVAAPLPPKPVVTTPAPEVKAKVVPPPPAAATRDADIATEQARRLELQRLAVQEAQQLKAQVAAQAAAEKAKLEAEKSKAKALADAERKALEAERAKTKAEALNKQKRDDAERKAEAEAKAEAREEIERLAKQREENLRRIMGQAGAANSGSGGTGNAAQSAAPSASYVGRLIAMIKPNIVFTGQVDGNPSAEVEVRAAAGGSILSKRLVKSSGNKEWDEAVLRAVDRTASLPGDNGLVPPALILVFRPKD